MRTKTFLIAVTALTLVAGQAAAQTAVTEESGTARAAETREAEVTRKLEQAEQRMAQAAREIAELTRDRLPNLERFEKRIELMASDRPRLGVTVGEVKENADPVEGVQVLAVTPGSAADDAGLRAGDVLTAVNDEKLSADSAGNATRRLLEFMEGVEEGDVLDVEYLRAGKVGSVQVEPRRVEVHTFSFGGFPGNFTMPDVPAAPGAPGPVAPRAFLGWGGSAWGDMELVELNEGLGKYFGTDSGVLVVCAPASDALQLEDGDVIQKIDGREPTSVRHALRILSSYAPGETLELQVMRDKRSRTLQVEMPDDRRSFVAPVAPAPARPASVPVPPKPAAVPEST